MSTPEPISPSYLELAREAELYLQDSTLSEQRGGNRPLAADAAEAETATTCAMAAWAANLLIEQGVEPETEAVILTNVGCHVPSAFFGMGHASDLQETPTKAWDITPRETYTIHSALTPDGRMGRLPIYSDGRTVFVQDAGVLEQTPNDHRTRRIQLLALLMRHNVVVAPPQAS
jgi:hypothetical protein